MDGHRQDARPETAGRVHASGQPGIPAGGRYRVEGRSPGSRVVTSVWPSQRFAPPVTRSDLRSPLTVAGAAPELNLAPSRRFAPASRLSSGALARPENLDDPSVPASRALVNRHIKKSLYGVADVRRRKADACALAATARPGRCTVERAWWDWRETGLSGQTADHTRSDLGVPLRRRIDSLRSGS